MKINEIKLGMSIVSKEGKLITKSGPRSVRTRYGTYSVADATLEYETGTINLSLGEQQIDMVLGDMVRINGAYVTEFNNQIQLNIPRSGVLEVKNKGSMGDVLEI